MMPLVLAQRASCNGWKGRPAAWETVRGQSASPGCASEAQDALQSHLFSSSAASFNDRLPFFPLYVSKVF